MANYVSFQNACVHMLELVDTLAETAALAIYFIIIIFLILFYF